MCIRQKKVLDNIFKLNYNYWCFRNAFDLLDNDWIDTFLGMIEKSSNGSFQDREWLPWLKAAVRIACCENRLVILWQECLITLEWPNFLATEVEPR